MFEKIEDDELLAVRVVGDLTKADYSQLAEWLHEHPGRQRPVMVFIDGFSGWASLGAVVEDLKMDWQDRDQFGRVALIGTSGWQQAMSLLTAPLVPMKMKYFDLDHVREAKAWVLEGSD
ncbi:hypothetical protein GCM10007989_25840 [Devosia pacifica]|uniref:STAS/SEC14 domain-containing protein n=1 Tax=Devosia pacifica TaxID=1335967 RepID=A0A918VW90_9HYPH|nr:STAS/SEC14 domain-containing protein [Devosia pacifica]GHA29111.1 hypothetical protein GCM10007989_25840 [Devosia pacifica]